MRQEMEENLQKKIALCERAEALKDSKDWNNHQRNELIIQKEWKEIVRSPKQVDSIWQRFIGACDHFFEQKKLQHLLAIRKGDDKIWRKGKNHRKNKQFRPGITIGKALNRLQQLIDEWYKLGMYPINER